MCVHALQQGCVRGLCFGLFLECLSPILLVSSITSIYLKELIWCGSLGKIVISKQSGISSASVAAPAKEQDIRVLLKRRITLR